ncbi:MAG: NIPSNAP family protein [Rhizobiaceae bacterium]
MGGLEAVAPLYELRHYVPAEGRSDALRKRFEDVTFGLFERHGFDVMEFWIEPRSGDFWYLLRWSDDDARKAAWKAFLEDEEWRAAFAASERDGPLAASIQSIRLEKWP